MAINRIPVDPEFHAAFRAVIDVMPVNGWDFERRESTGVQNTDPITGYPVWEVAVAVKVAEDRKAETIFVRVPHPTRPDIEGQRVVFGGLEVSMAAYANTRGEATTVDSSWKFTARSVANAASPSSRTVDKAPVPTHNDTNGKVGASA